MRFRFITATPQDIAKGSGTFTGIRTLRQALEAEGVEVTLTAPRGRFPIYTVHRLLFNRTLTPASSAIDVQVGFDMDGYRLAGRGMVPHVAAIKGVIGDELQFETGLTRATMAIQAAREALHVRRADLVIATSRYSARRLAELYGIGPVDCVVPELIDLEGWRALFGRNPAAPPREFTVLSVCRFYPRKRLDVLLKAAARLRSEIPSLQFRLVGGGPEAARLRRLHRELGLGESVRWLGDLSQDALAREYNACRVFCLPSVQEGFGIVLLEAMAAGKPVVAARAASVPEVVPHGVLVDPDSPEALAAGIASLYRDAGLREACAEAGRIAVHRFEARTVARAFLSEINGRRYDRVHSARAGRGGE